MKQDDPIWEVLDHELEDTSYTYETHEATSEDGSILNLVRLIKTDECEEKSAGRTPIIFQHGFLRAS